MIRNIDRAKVEEGRLKALQDREDKIKQATNRGVPVCYLSAPLSLEERETHINIMDNVAIIDTTVDRYITKCFKNNYEIIGITIYDNKVVGLTCKANAKQITLRS